MRRKNNKISGSYDLDMCYGSKKYDPVTTTGPLKTHAILLFVLYLVEHYADDIRRFTRNRFQFM
jgi:hypothetical protein